MSRGLALDDGSVSRHARRRRLGMVLAFASAAGACDEGAAKPDPSAQPVLARVERSGEVWGLHAEDGRAFVLDAGGGRFRRTWVTEAKGWTVPIGTRSAGPVIRGSPALAGADSALFVVGTTLRSGTSDTKSRSILESPLLAGARLVVPAGEHVAVGREDGKIVLVRGSEAHEHAGPPAPVTALLASPDGRRVYAGCTEASWSVLEVGTGAVQQASGHLGDPPVIALAMTSDGRTLAVSHGDVARIKMFKIGGQGEVVDMLGWFKESAVCLALAFDAEGKRLAAGFADGTVRVFALKPVFHELETLVRFSPHKLPVRGVMFSPTDPLLVVSVDESAEAVALVAEGKDKGKEKWRIRAVPKRN